MTRGMDLYDAISAAYYEKAAEKRGLGIRPQDVCPICGWEHMGEIGCIQCGYSREQPPPPKQRYRKGKNTAV